jgi:hypothetical protein
MKGNEIMKDNDPIQFLLRLSSSARRPPQWRLLAQSPDLAIYELLLAPLGWTSLFMVIHYPAARAVVFAQPLRGHWGTSITNAAEWVAKAAYDKLAPANYYEWYYDKGSLDEVLPDFTTGRVAWRPFSIQRFQEAHQVELPRLMQMPEVRAAERDYTARYVKHP